tara:strand:+ start:104 stop:607 length:504 start_codon:yes stop_codon:yes gene_type:complete
MKEIYLNFGGFYGKHDLHVESMIEHFDINPESVDFKETYINYAKEWVNAFNSEHDLNLEFIGIDSPRFYNYSTDKIKVNIDHLECHILKRNHINDTDFIDYANERLTSRSGFISFYDGLEDLKERAKENKSDYILLIELILDFVIDSNDEIYIHEFEIISKLTYKTT